MKSLQFVNDLSSIELERNLYAPSAPSRLPLLDKFKRQQTNQEIQNEGRQRYRKISKKQLESEKSYVNRFLETRRRLEIAADQRYKNIQTAFPKVTPIIDKNRRKQVRDNLRKFDDYYNDKVYTTSFSEYKKYRNKFDNQFDNDKFRDFVRLEKQKEKQKIEIEKRKQMDLLQDFYDFKNNTKKINENEIIVID